MAAPKGPNLQTFFNDPNSAAVAGYLTAEPYLAVQRNVPVKFFLFAEQGYPPYANTMVTTTSYLKGNSDVVARFTRASVEGWKDYLRDPTAGNALIKKLNPQMPDEHINYSLRQDARGEGGRRRRRRHHGHRHHDRGALAEDLRDSWCRRSC